MGASARVLKAEDDFAARRVIGQRVITGSSGRQHFRFAAARKGQGKQAYHPCRKLFSIFNHNLNIIVITYLFTDISQVIHIVLIKRVSVLINRVFQFSSSGGGGVPQRGEVVGEKIIPYLYDS